MRARTTLMMWGVGCAALLAAGCGEGVSSADAGPSSVRPAVGESPESVVAAMLALARAGDWGAYVDRYYGEQHKFRPGGEDRDRLVARIAGHGAEIIAGLERASEISPVLSEDGTRATFEIEPGRFFTLYLQDGAWRFHL